MTSDVVDGAPEERITPELKKSDFSLTKAEFEWLEYLCEALSGINEFLRECGKPLGGCKCAMVESSTRELSNELYRILKKVQRRSSGDENCADKNDLVFTDSKE